MAKHLTKPLSRKLLVKIVVNKKEYDAIAKAARKRGLSMSAYAREKALGLDLTKYLVAPVVTVQK